MRHVTVALVTVMMTAASVYAASPIKVKTANGAVIAGSDSYRTLYLYAKDKGGIPSCYGDCAKKWPPHVAEYWDDPRPPFGTVKRKDGKKQWTKDGMPLYFSTLDKKKGDTKGDGVEGLWKVVRP